MIKEDKVINSNTLCRNITSKKYISNLKNKKYDI